MKNLSKATVAVCLLLSTTACSSMKGLNPTFNLHKPVPVTPPRVSPMTLNSVNWKVYDVAALKELVAKLESSGQSGTIIYVLTQDGFQTLALNLTEMKRYITDQKDANDFLVKSMTINGSKEEKTEK